MLMNSADYRESLRRYTPRVFVDGARDRERRRRAGARARHQRHRRDLRFRPRDELAPLMRAVQASSGKTVNRMLHINQSSADLLNKLEAVRLALPGDRLRATLPRP